MKNKILIISSIASVLFLASSANIYAASNTPVTVTGGTINFTGKVIDAACTVDVNTQDQNIQLGQIKKTILATVGATSAAIPFSIRLVDCDTSTYQTATFGFSGVTVSDDPTSLANVSGPGSATGVGVQLTDEQGGIVPLDYSFDTGSAVTLQDGENIANFTAAMIATSVPVTAGDVTSTVNFNIQYD